MAATLYDLLGIEKSASPEEVRKAYKQKALETHPDKFLELGATEEEKEAAEARFHKVCEAFEILNDPQKRRSYDVRMDIKVDYEKRYANLSDHQLRRQKDREEWARQVEHQHQERMKALREGSRLARELIEQKEKEAREHKSMVEDMLQELCRQNPEWEARKKSVQRLKVERARARGIRPTQTRSS